MNRPQGITAIGVIVYCCDESGEWLPRYACAVVAWYGLEWLARVPRYLQSQRIKHRIDREFREAQERVKKQLAEDHRRWKETQRALEEQRVAAERVRATQEKVPEKPKETNEEKLERLYRKIDDSLLSPEFKLSLKGRARRAYEDDVEKIYRW
jgi:hypothetical protein